MESSEIEREGVTLKPSFYALDNIADRVAQHNGSYKLDDGDLLDTNSTNTTYTTLIPSTTPIILYCGYHSWTTQVEYFMRSKKWCNICDLLGILRLVDKEIICVQNTYEAVAYCPKFEFICSKGHHFVTDSRGCKRGCRSCDILEIARKKHGVGYSLTLDCECVNIHNGTKLRFHCNKLRHDPNCNDPDCMMISDHGYKNQTIIVCKNVIPCNQDFYATTSQLKTADNVYSCMDNHRWLNKKCIVTMHRMFEIFFDQRFDDSTFVSTLASNIVNTANNIEFTGYSAYLKIAYTHGMDSSPNKCLKKSKEWCVRNRVRFIYIPEKMIETKYIAREVIRQMKALELISGSESDALMGMRTKMRKMNRENKLYEDRCVYYSSETSKIGQK